MHFVPLLAHGATPHSTAELWSSWAWDPGVVIPLALSLVLYVHGVRRFWKIRIGMGIHVAEACCFAGGWLTLGIALVSPLHPWGRVLFSAHMVQHELLMLVAAPLLVLGKPLVAILKAFPGSWSHGLVSRANTPVWQRLWRIATYPLAAWLIHAIAL